MGCSMPTASICECWAASPARSLPGLDLPRLGVEIALGREPVLEPVRVRTLHFEHLHGELAALRGTIRGVPPGRSAAEIATGIVLAAVLSGRMLYRST